MWQRIKRYFRDSETLFWARFQAVLGVVAGIITYVEPEVLAPLMPAEWFPYFLVVNGILTEYLRRRRASDLNGEPDPKEPDWETGDA
ncbi:hypothetical protein GN330_22570 [Nitratireductor sp. CAU 1489]|uniref:Uncharacterized protein n=1 Tax=Nitratireductor arenosus TaxID=2682096 RepID=A0A844QPR7_9HYPH|nr:hypothetical protein [Nitratireductor arenosus]MVB00039.1 hypothetical protein [Nitratireductor arenosus]